MYIKHKKCVTVLCITFVRNISSTDKYLVAYAKKCLQVSMWCPSLLAGSNRNLNPSTRLSKTA
jgi:hypothetical protein